MIIFENKRFRLEITLIREGHIQLIFSCFRPHQTKTLVLEVNIQTTLPECFHWKNATQMYAGILNNLLGVKNPVGIGLSYRPARLHRLAELVPKNRFLGSLKI